MNNKLEEIQLWLDRLNKARQLNLKSEIRRAEEMLYKLGHNPQEEKPKRSLISILFK